MHHLAGKWFPWMPEFPAAMVALILLFRYQGHLLRVRARSSPLNVAHSGCPNIFTLEFLPLDRTAFVLSRMSHHDNTFTKPFWRNSLTCPSPMHMEFGGIHRLFFVFNRIVQQDHLNRPTWADKKPFQTSACCFLITTFIIVVLYCLLFFLILCLLVDFFQLGSILESSQPF